MIRFIETHCTFTNGEWIGQPFRLLPWQKRTIYRLFEVGDNDLRQYRWAMLGVPKKNGKTELIAAIGLYLLIADDEPAPLVVCAAASDEQADLVFGAAKTMCELSPTLSLITERYDKEILVPSSPGAKLIRVAAAAGTNDGRNIHAALLDELHEWQGTKGENVYHVLTNGTGARRQPLIIQITTAGYDLDTICGRQYEYGKRVASGEIDDPRYYFEWHEAPEGSDYRDPAAWEAANPSYGVTVRPESFADLLRKPEHVFRRYFLNQWTATKEAWLPAGAWDACRDDTAQLDPTLPLYVGIDVGIKHDSSAVALAQLQGDRTILRAKVWENPYAENDPRHNGWKLPIAEVENWLRELFSHYRTPATAIDGEVKPGPEFCYDPHFFERSAQDLLADGLAMVEYPQMDSRMIPASQTFYDLVVAGSLVHDGNPDLTRHVNNAAADQKPRGWRLTKRARGRKIDAAVAAAIAVHRAQQPAPVAQTSVYESRGLLVL